MDEEKIGDLKEKSFLDLWFSEKANRLRMLHINKQFDKIKICENCNYYSGPGVNSEEIKEFLHILNSQSKN